MILNFLDTSAILNGALGVFDNIYISPLVLSELENIKNSNRDEHTKYLARQAVRDILESHKIKYCIAPQNKIERILKKYKFLSNINDHILLCEAIWLQKETNDELNFITSDGALALFARQIPGINGIFWEKENRPLPKEYAGWGKYYPQDKQFAEIYSSPQFNTLNATVNEYCELFEGSELKDIVRWDGQRYSPLKYSNLNNKFLNKNIKPLNLEQKMAFDLLQNPTVSVKLLIGPPGSGKDYLMLLHALDLIQKGAMDKIIFIRNLVPFKDAPEIGFLSGDLQEKIAWGLGPLASILGEEGLSNFQEQGIIEAANLGFIRGCSWDRTIIYVSEGQNITGGGYKLLVSRCGDQSQLWVNGDIFQTDNKKFEENNGLQRLINSLSGNELFGMVKLLKTERSKTAELASII